MAVRFLTARLRQGAHRTLPVARMPRGTDTDKERPMRKISIVIAAVAGLGLAACEVSEEDAGTTSVTSTSASARSVEQAAAPATTEPSREEIADMVFDNLLDSEGVGGSRYERELWSRTMCTFLDEGNSWPQLLVEMAANPHAEIIPGLPTSDIPLVMGASVGAYCPEHEHIIKSAAGR